MKGKERAGRREMCEGGDGRQLCEGGNERKGE